MGLSGVSNWRGVIGKVTGPTGGRSDVKGVISDFDLLQLKYRRVIVAFDADAKNNEDVRIAWAELSKKLRSRGAAVAFLEWISPKGRALMIIWRQLDPMWLWKRSPLSTSPVVIGGRI